MSAAAEFRAAYRAALAAHLAEGGERGLRTAYELGRDAVERGLGVLDLAAVHHEGLAAALGRSSGREEAESVTRAAGDFLLESLSAFEMIQRGFSEAHQAAVLERRHAAIVRRLSSLLADESLAFAAPDSLEEMLQLVAEQARELTNARACLATAAAGPAGAPIEAASYAEVDTWSEATQNVGTGQFAAGDAHEAQSRLSAPLTALDGRDFGSIEVFDKADGEFTELDEAIVVHLAQMAAAALERARLYRPG
jgi:GAF domain-containing protein